MYGLPPKHILEGFVGRELVQICIGTQQMQFRFHPEGAIYAESGFWYENPNGKREFYDEFWRREAAPNSLLSSSVSAIEYIGAKSMRFRFNNGGCIELTDDSNQFEAFQFEIDGNTIIV